MNNMGTQNDQKGSPQNRGVLSLRAIDVLYCAYLFSVVLMSTIGMGAGDSAYVVVVVIGAIFALSRIMSIRFSPQFLLLAIALTCLGVIEFYISRRTTLLLTALLLVSAKEIQPRLLIGTFLAAKIIGLCLVVALVITGVFGVETYQYFKMATGTYIQRVFVNGSSTTIMHLSFLAIIFLSFYMKKGRCGLVYYFGFFFLDLICANITGSYMGFLLGIGGLALFWICQHVNKFRGLLVKYSTAVLPLLLLLTFGTAFMFGHSSAVDAIDRLFQGRVYYNHYFMSNYSVSLFGHGMLSDEGNFDNSFVFVLVAYGAVTFCVLFGSIQLLIFRLKEQADWVSIALVVVYLIAALSESFYPAAAVNPSLLLLVPLFELVGQGEEKTLTNPHAAHSKSWGRD